MAELTEFAAQLVLLLTSFLLIWYIFRLREKRKIGDPELKYEYDGRARNPHSLIDPDELALKELDRLIEDDFNQ